MKPPRLNAQEIEIAVARHFNYRQNLIVPNVYWGLGLNYEADLVVLRPSGWAIEVEIKVSKQDIKADLNKRHKHDSNLFKALYFAVPDALKDDPNIPSHAGIIAIEKTPDYIFTKKVRVARIKKNAIKWDNALRQKLYELAAMRIWLLKDHLLKAKNRRGAKNAIRSF